MGPYIKSTPVIHGVNPPEHYLPPYWSHVHTTTGPHRAVSTAGQVGCDENGNYPEDIGEQISLALENLQKTLAAVGATVQDISKMVFYQVGYDPSNRVHSKIVAKFLDGHRPGTTLVPVPVLASPALKFEIDAWAAVPLAPLREVDVVVVGGGLSGLKAAWEVQKAGFSCVVVEARDRVGGRTYSVDPLGEDKYVDLGGAWLNDTNQTAVYELSQTLGLELVVQTTNGDVIYDGQDGALERTAYGTVPKSFGEEGGDTAVAKLNEEIDKAAEEIDIHNPTSTAGDLEKVTLLEWAKTKTSSKTALSVLHLSSRSMIGIEPSEVSASMYLYYVKSGGGLARMRSDFKHGGQHLRFIDGSQSVSLKLAERLRDDSILLNSPVFKITQAAGRIHVAAARGNFSAKKVIVSVQSLLYRSITFEPPLPPSKLGLADSGVQSCSFKNIFLFSEPWWRKNGLAGAFMSFNGPLSAGRDTSNDKKGQFSLTCFANGQLGRDLGKLPKAEQKKLVLEHLKRVFAPYCEVPEPLAIVQKQWSKDLWSRVCSVPFLPPGEFGAHDHARRTPHENIHFVGTETAHEWKGYMDGAVSSGARGAKEVIQSLSESKL